MSNALAPTDSVSLGQLTARIADLERNLMQLRGPLVGSQPFARHEITVQQTAHGFLAGNFVRFDHLGSFTWKLAKADETTDENDLGIVYRVRNANEFRVVLSGSVELDLINQQRGSTRYPNEHYDHWLTTTGGDATQVKPSINARLCMHVYGNQQAIINPRQVATPAESWLIVITHGNTLYAASGGWSAVLGIKKLASGTISSVPTTTPGASGTYTDGLGAGTLVLPSGGPGGRVWVANGNVTNSLGATVVQAGSIQQLPKDTLAMAMMKVTIACAAGGTADIYIPFAA